MKDFKKFVERISSKISCPLPVSVWLEITQRCNLNCKFCFVGRYKNKNPDFPLEKIFRIIDDLQRGGCIEITLSGGEPLIREDFLEIYTYVKKKGFFITIFTNGTLLKDNILNVFYKYPPRCLYISLHAGSLEGYEKVAGNSSAFKAIKKGMSLLKKRNIKFRVKTLITKTNFSEIDKILNFCKEFGVIPEIYTYVIPPFNRSDYKCDKFSLSPKEEIVLLKKISDRSSWAKVVKKKGLFDPRYHAIITNEGRVLSPFKNYRYWYSRSILKEDFLECWKNLTEGGRGCEGRREEKRKKKVLQAKGKKDSY